MANEDKQKQIEILRLRKRKLQLQQQLTTRQVQAAPGVAPTPGTDQLPLQPLKQQVLDPTKQIAEEEDPSKLVRGGRFVRSVGPEVAGGTLGAMGAVRAMGALPHALPKILAGLITAAGAGGGAAAGEQVRAQLPGEEPATLESTLAAGGRGLVGEAVGRGAVAVGQKVLAPFKKVVSKETETALNVLGDRMPKPKGFEFITSAGRRHPGLLPAEATDNRILDIMQNISESSLIGGGKIQTFKANRSEVIRGIADEMVEVFGKSADPDMAGEVFARTVAKQIKPSRMAANSLYNTVDDMTQGIVVPTASMKKFALPLVKVSEELGGVGAASSGDDLIGTISQMPDGISFRAAKELRSRLLSVVDEFSITNKKAPAIGKAKKLIGFIDEATSNALKANNPEALGLWREANKIYKEGSKQFDNAFIRRLIKSADPDFGGSPESIVKAIWKPKNPTNIIRARKAVMGPKKRFGDHAWRKIQGYGLQDLVEGATDPSTGIISGKKLLNRIKALGGTFNEGFSVTQRQGIKDFAETLNRVQTRQGEGTGRMLIQLTQGGMALGLFGAGLTPEAGAVLLGPAVLARMFTNPIAAKWLSQGLELPASSPASAGLFGRVMGAMAESEKSNEQFMGDTGAGKKPDDSFFERLRQAETKSLQEQSRRRPQATPPLTPRLSQSLRQPPTIIP